MKYDMLTVYSKFNVQSLCMCVRWNVGSSLSLAAELGELQLGSHKVYDLALKIRFQWEKHSSKIHFRATH